MGSWMTTISGNVLLKKPSLRGVDDRTGSEMCKVNITSRRHFVYLAGSVVLSKEFLASGVWGVREEYVIFQGWVLKSDDLSRLL